MSNIFKKLFFAFAVALVGCGAGTPLNPTPASTTDVAVADAVASANRDVVSTDVQCRTPVRCGELIGDAINNASCEILGTLCGRRTCFRDRNGCQVWAYSRP